MNRFYIFITIALFFTCTLNAQDVPEIQRPLIGKVAATWCPPCGGWGWDLFENLVEDNEEKATLMAVHHSGDLTNSVAQDFATNFEAPYQPYFYFNTEDQNATSSNADVKRTEIEAMVNDASLLNPVANAGLIVQYNEEGVNKYLVIWAKTTFFQEVDGEFYLGVYFVENNIINNQAGQGPEAVHEKILRESITAGSFGELIFNGPITAGSEVDFSFIPSINNNWNLGYLEENVELVTIIWEKVDDKYLVVNTNKTNEYFLPVNVNDINFKTVALDVYPTNITSHASISIHSEDMISEAQLEMVNSKGQVVSQLFSGTIESGFTSIILDNNNDHKGLHFLVLQSNGQVISKPIVLY